MDTTISEKANILIVDDRHENLYVLEKILTPLNINVYKATSGTDALSIALQEELGLILLDVQMPEMDGYEVMELFHLEKRLMNIPVIFITAHYTDELHRMKGYNLGAVDYLYKPLDEKILLSKVNVFLELHRQKRENYKLKQRYELILDSAGEGIFGLDPEGKFNFVNPAAALLLGHSTNDLIGNSIASIMPDGESFNWQESDIYKTSSSGFFHRVSEGAFLKKDKSKLPVDYVITSLRDENNNYLGVVLAFQDVSDRKLKQDAEKRLQHSAKMEAIGQLTGGVAHDFNNILLIAQGNLEMLAHSLKDDHQKMKHLQESMKAIERGSDLTKHLLAFARKQTLFPKSIDVKEHITNTISLLKPALSERITIEPNYEHEPWNIWVDPIQFENAIMNLAINARDAMPKGGYLRFNIKNLTIDSGNKPHHAMQSGDFVHISITDEGEGIPEEIIDRIFEPFFTTKQPGAGTGLGLSMVYGFINQSNGHIMVNSAIGIGSTFHLYLPRSKVQSGKNTMKEEKLKSLKGSETILIAEDESAILELVSTYLASLGYTVITATNGEEALNVIKSGQKIDLLFSDVIMSGDMTGPELGAEARKILPNLKMLFTSGYSKNALQNSAVKINDFQQLTKPYKLDVLATQLRLILDKKSKKHEHTS